MNEIDEALNWFKNYALPALSNTPHDIGHALVIKNTLTAAKEREAVDVERLKKKKGEWQSTRSELKMQGYNQAIDDMHERGLLTSSEKPTHSIPEGYALVPVEPTEAISAAFYQAYADVTRMTGGTCEYTNFRFAYKAVINEAAKGEGE